MRPTLGPDEMEQTKRAIWFMSRFDAERLFTTRVAKYSSQVVIVTWQQQQQHERRVKVILSVNWRKGAKIVCKPFGAAAAAAVSQTFGYERHLEFVYKRAVPLIDYVNKALATNVFLSTTKEILKAKPTLWKNTISPPLAII